MNTYNPKGENGMDWKLAALAFGTLFLAELGDKTQLAVFTLAAQNRNPWPVFIGASAALVVVTLLGAFLGGFITKYVPASTLQLVAGLLFVVIGAFTLHEAAPELVKTLFK
jgi:putative Ca2+/H+ antiporter (TMEM165/GDT1 family)